MSVPGGSGPEEVWSQAGVWSQGVSAPGGSGPEEVCSGGVWSLGCLVGGVCCWGSALGVGGVCSGVSAPGGILSWVGCLLMGVSAPGGIWSWGVSGPGAGRVCSKGGLLPGEMPGGYLLPGTATAAGGKHPTGMHACLQYSASKTDYITHFHFLIELCI